MNRSIRIPAAALCALAVFLSTFHHAFGGDWLMWRADAQRSGVTAASLPDSLHLLWSRELPKVRPAWENEERLHFDASYHPVVIGKNLIVASPNDGSVAAFQTDTGSELWRFYTNGPVRVAPAASSKGSVYIGSDDGYLYCLDSQSGKQLWKLRAAPEERSEYYHLGNSRLVSFWPVRGGPVVSEDEKTVYFGSGIWPSMGVFVYAADANTGKMRWLARDAHFLPDTRIDHNYLHEAGISPQGHLAIAGETLVVANGRSMPARLDLRTGELLHFVQGYRNGDSRVTVSGNLALVGSRGIMDLKTGLEVGAAPFLEAGKDAPQGWDWSKKDQFEGPFYRYKFFKGCDYRSVLENGIAYGAENGVVYTYDLAGGKITRYDAKDAGRVLKPVRLELPLLWKYQGRTGEKNAQSTPNSLVKAGDQLYTHFDNTLIALKIHPSGGKNAPELVWSMKLPETPLELVAGDDKLFAVGESGAIHCLGGAKPTSVTRYQIDETSDVNETGINRAAQLLAASGVSAGYALVLGIKNGALVKDLLEDSNLSVIAIDSDLGKMTDLRRRLSVDGPWQERFQGIAADPERIEIAPFLASLITSELPRETCDGRVFEMLRPYGGVACFEKPARDDNSPDFLIERRKGALPGSANWTHETGDAARTYFSRDKRVKSPLAILWYGDGEDYGFHKRKDYGHGVKPMVAGGRLFALQIASQMMHAVDAYTGRLLWKCKVDDSARYAAWPDALYVAQGRSIDVIDAATGETRDTWRIDFGDAPEVKMDTPVNATDIRVTEKTVLAGLRFNNEHKVEKGRWDSRFVAVFDRASGEQLWSRRAAQRYSTAAVAIAKDTIYCIDSHSPVSIFDMRKGDDRKKADQLKSTILALEAKTGREKWNYILDNPPAELRSIHFLGLRTADDWLACSTDKNLVIAGKNSRTVALDLDTGKLIWERNSKGQQPLIIAGDTFFNQVGHTYETATGKVLNGNRLFARGGCNYAVGCENLIFLRDNCAAYVDVESREQYNLRNIRSGCSASLVAADGLLNAPCFSVGCICNYPLQTSFAMFHLPESGGWIHHHDPDEKSDTPATGEAPVNQ